MTIAPDDDLIGDLACTNPRCVDGWITVADDPSTVYPCKKCRPDLFYRWAEGHFNAAHLDEPCSVCAEVRGTTYTGAGKKRRRGRSKAAANEPTPTPPPVDEGRRYGNDD